MSRSFSYARIDDDIADDDSSTKGEKGGREVGGSGVKVLSVSKNLFCVNPGPIKIGRKTFLMFTKHIPTFYQGKDVSALIDESGMKCTIKFTMPIDLLDPSIVTSDANVGKCENDAINQSICEWHESRQIHSASELEEEMVLGLPFKCKLSFSKKLLSHRQDITNSLLFLGKNSATGLDIVHRQLVLVFEKVDDNFVREATSSTLFDFSSRIKTPEDASIRRME